MQSSNLFSSLKLGGLNLKNRIALAPMTRARAGRERVPNQIMADYYCQRASAGLLITEATVVSKQGIGWNNTPGIYTPEMVKGWSMVTERVRQTGTPFFLQLWHCGRVSHSDFLGGELPPSASAVRIENGEQIHTPLGKKPYETPRALTLEEIKTTVRNFRNAAQNAKDAGFSGIEVHGANGYLINQFLDAKSNKRTDAYGGSIQNRFRFFKEVIEAVLEIWPSAQVGARISPNGIFNDMGSPDFREAYLYAAEEMNRLKLGYLHVMDGLAFGFHNQGKPMTLAEFRGVFKGVLMGNCGYTPESAEERIQSNDADMIAFGRPYITNPDLVERLKNHWPLAPFQDMSKWYSPGPEGYSDYPVYEKNLLAAK